MDKQIIIDNVDVSGCVKLRPYNECGCQPNYGGSYGLCSEWGNCYYKKLIRKEQECEMLRGSNVSILTTLELIMGSNKRLEAENEELKEQLDSVVREWEEYTETYKQVLQEIKHIAEDQKDVLESMRIDIAEQILNKISEVLDERSK